MPAFAPENVAVSVVSVRAAYDLIYRNPKPHKFPPPLLNSHGCEIRPLPRRRDQAEAPPSRRITSIRIIRQVNSPHPSHRISQCTSQTHTCQRIHIFPLPRQAQPPIPTKPSTSLALQPGSWTAQPGRHQSRGVWRSTVFFHFYFCSRCMAMELWMGS